MSAEEQLVPVLPALARVLNVDDTEVARYTKSRTLQHAGFGVLEAGTGAEALRLMEAEQPALALLDVKLPDINGLELCKQIKARWPGTMVLQTSATFVNAADRARGLEGGADAYLTQPIDADELVAAVRALLRLHAAEEASRALNETLEQRVKERTRELAQANLRLIEQISQRERAEEALVQSQKMEVVGQLTGAMAHDFNNLLASMVGYMHLIRLKTQDTDLQGLVDKALAAADRGSKLTARLLAFARTERPANQAVDLRLLLAGMRDLLDQSVGRGVTIQTALGEGDLVALTDSNQLELALLNVVINARDAMPQGGQLLVDARRATLTEADGELQPGDYVLLGISDSGQGMSPEVAKRAFDPFFTTKPVGRGTGLGLSQVYNLARQSKGTARLETVPGKGTCVMIWLAAGDSRSLAPGGDDGQPLFRGQGQRVLVVDDEPDIRNAVAQILGANGYEVQTAADGAEGLALLSASPPDLLILDFAMPGLNGIEVAKRVRQSAVSLPILFISGHVDIELLEAAASGVRLLRKPFNPVQLGAAVLRALQEGAAQGAERG